MGCNAVDQANTSRFVDRITCYGKTRIACEAVISCGLLGHKPCVRHSYNAGA
jgi:hypothetical protein